MGTGERLAHSLVSGALFGTAPAMLLPMTSMPQNQATLGVATLVVGGALLSLVINARSHAHVPIEPTSTPVPEPETETEDRSLVLTMPKKQKAKPNAELKTEAAKLSRWLASRTGHYVESVRSSAVTTEYILNTVPGTRLSPKTIQGLLPELREFVYRTRGKRSGRVSVSVDVQPLRIVIAREDALELAYAQMVGMIPLGASNQRVYLGAGAGMQPAYLTFEKGGPAVHGLIAGKTGAGKSTLMRTLILQLAERFTPDELGIFLVNTKSTELRQFEGLPHVMGTAWTEERALPLIMYLADQSGRSELDGGREEYPDKMWLLIVDEVQRLSVDSLNADAFKAAFDTILTTGRSKHIGLVMATQEPTAQMLTRPMRTQLAWKAFGRVEKSTASDVFKRAYGVENAHELRGKGDFLLVTDDDRFRFQVALSSEQDSQSVTTKLQKQFGLAHHMTIPELRKVAQPVPDLDIMPSLAAALPQDEGPTEVETLRPYFADLFEADGTPKRGALSKIGQLLGFANPSNPNYKKKILDAGSRLAQEVA